MVATPLPANSAAAKSEITVARASGTTSVAQVWRVDYPEANLRQYAFMLEGLKDAGEALEERGIQLAVQSGSPDEVALRSGENASMIVCDMSYLRLQKGWRERLAKKARCLVMQVETEVVVPVELASNKREHAARTLRPRIREHLGDFLVELAPTQVEKQSLSMNVEGLDLSDIDGILDDMNLDDGASRISHLYRGGTSEAKRIFGGFIKNRFGDYV